MSTQPTKQAECLHDDMFCPLHKAAPDLLAALKHTQSILHGDVCQQYADCVEACENALDAIAKAEEGS